MSKYNPNRHRPRLRGLKTNGPDIVDYDAWRERLRAVLARPDVESKEYGSAHKRAGELLEFASGWGERVAEHRREMRRINPIKRTAATAPDAQPQPKPAKPATATTVKPKRQRKHQLERVTAAAATPSLGWWPAGYSLDRLAPWERGA